MLSRAVRWPTYLSILLISVGQIVKCDFEILVLHTNDMHSRFDETDVQSKPVQKPGEPVYGGFARLKKAVDDARAEAASRNIPSVFLNAGDTFQGTAFYTMLKDEVVSSLIQLLGIEVMSLGNHEFDDGVQTLAKYLRHISIPVVACNLNFAHEKDLQLPTLTPSVVLQKNNKQIGVIGYLLPETKNTSNTGNVIFYDEIESISKEARRLKTNGINIIVALGHSGFEMDKQIAKSIPEVSLVIGGHTNTFLYTPPEKPPSIETPEGPYPVIEVQASGRKVPVVQAYAYTKYLGKLWITFDDNGNFVSARPESNPLLLNSSTEEDTLVKTKVLEWKGKFEDIVHTVLGRTNVHLDGWKSGCKKQECNLGNFITDALIDAVASQYNASHGWTDAAIAVIQGGALRSAITENKTHGNFTYEEILTILPYKTPMYKVRVRGSDLRAAMEQSISKHNANTKEVEITGEFLQVSGIRVVYDLSKPVNQRISKLEVRCANCSVPRYSALNDSATYTIIMSEYLRDGGDGYQMFKNGLSEPIMENGYALADTDAVANYFKKSQVNYPGIDGRIMFVNDELPVSPSKSSSPINSSIITLFVSLSFVTWFYNMFTVATTVHHS